MQDIRGAVHTAVFHALHDLGTVFRLRDSEYRKRPGLPDIIFGSLATLMACLCIAWCGKRNKKVLACLMPVVCNGLIVGAMLTVVIAGLNPVKNFGAFAVFAGQVALGEAAVMFIAGLPLLSWLPKQKFFADYVSRT